MEKIKVILVSAKTQSIEEIEITQHSLREMYDTIESDEKLIEAAKSYDNGDILYCDGSWKSHKPYGFTYPNWSYPIAGNAIVVGGNRFGEDCDSKSTVEDIKKNIIFLP